MKKAVIYLLAAVMLVSTAAQAQKQKKLTESEAKQLLQKTVGNWQINSYEWQPKSGIYVETTGRASFESAHGGNYVREQFELTKSDGTKVSGEGFLRYSEANKRFEFVQLDNEGKCILLMTGKWHPEYNLLTFSNVKEAQGSADEQGMAAHWQYYFLEDGSIKKIVRKPNMKGQYMITSTNHYQPSSTAGL